MTNERTSARPGWYHLRVAGACGESLPMDVPWAGRDEPLLGARRRCAAFARPIRAQFDEARAIYERFRAEAGR